MTKKIAIAASACLVALTVAGCAVEVPMSAFRMAPPDPAQKTDVPPLQDARHLSVQ